MGLKILIKIFSQLNKFHKANFKGLQVIEMFRMNDVYTIDDAG